MKKNTKAKLRLVIILIALVIVTIIGVMEYHNVTNIKRIAQNKNTELKEQTVWNSETQGLGLEVTEADITTKSITVKVVKAEIESASEQDLEYKYYIKESNKVDYAKTASYTGAEKSYTYSNLVAGKNYDVKVVLTNTNTKTEVETEIKVINTKQMPNAQEEITKGTIAASEPTWSNEKASVTLSTTTGLEIEYQVNTATEGGWTQGTTVSNLKNGDIVRVRLSDGKNKGNAGSITIGEEAQEVSITAQETTANSITVKVASNNKEYREETRPEYSYYIKEASTANYPSTPTYTGTDSYTFNSLTSGTKYDIKVVLTNKAGNVIQGELKENETIEEGLTIGSIVTYNPSGTYNWLAKYYTTETTPDVLLESGEGKPFNITTWRVLSIDKETGKVELVPTEPTTGTVELKGAQGYNNAVKLLNDACSSLYGNSIKEIEARSINIEDIEKYMTDSAKSNAHNYINTESNTAYNNKVSSPYRGEYCIYPVIYKKEIRAVINGNENLSGLGVSEQTTFVELTEGTSTTSFVGSITTATKVQPYQTYWYKDGTYMQTAFKNYNKQDETQGNYYNLIMPNGTNTTYFIASRCVNNNADFCVFSLYGVSKGEIIEYELRGSGKLSGYCYSKIFPIVSLSYDSITGNSITGFTVE